MIHESKAMGSGNLYTWICICFILHVDTNSITKRKRAGHWQLTICKLEPKNPSRNSAHSRYSIHHVNDLTTKFSEDLPSPFRPQKLLLEGTDWHYYPQHLPYQREGGAPCVGVLRFIEVNESSLMKSDSLRMQTILAIHCDHALQEALMSWLNTPWRHFAGGTNVLTWSPPSDCLSSLVTRVSNNSSHMLVISLCDVWPIPPPSSPTSQKMLDILVGIEY